MQFKLKITKSPRAFTLIELIVVVTILAILGAIGFVTMTGYFAGARDSARLSDMNSIYAQLNLTAGMDGILPYPDSYRPIAIGGTISGDIIAYQGYAAKTVLTTIKFEKGGRDPKDDVYYTYTTDKKRKQAQLMGYFEEYDTTKLSNITKLIPEANAVVAPVVEIPITSTSDIDYSDRKIGMFGKRIGILLEPTTLMPVQQNNTGILNITTTSTPYVVYFDTVTTGSGAGSDLKAAYMSSSVIYNTGGVSNISTTTPATSSCNAPDIFVGSGDRSQVWSVCNVGATTTWNGMDSVNETCNGTKTDCNSNLTWRGKFYQWGRNTPGFVNDVIPASGAWGSSSSAFYSEMTVEEKQKAQGPCNDGYHIPTKTEFFLNNEHLAEYLFPGGATDMVDMTFEYWAGSNWGVYWTSTKDSDLENNAMQVIFDVGDGFYIDSYDKNSGALVRCIKNSDIVPNVALCGSSNLGWYTSPTQITEPCSKGTASGINHINNKYEWTCTSGDDVVSCAANEDIAS